jgi:hypothetical protein
MVILKASFVAELETSLTSYLLVKTLYVNPQQIRKSWNCHLFETGCLLKGFTCIASPGNRCHSEDGGLATYICQIWVIAELSAFAAEQQATLAGLQLAMGVSHFRSRH